MRTCSTGCQCHPALHREALWREHRLHTCAGRPWTEHRHGAGDHRPRPVAGWRPLHRGGERADGPGAQLAALRLRPAAPVCVRGAGLGRRGVRRREAATFPGARTALTANGRAVLRRQTTGIGCDRRSAPPKCSHRSGVSPRLLVDGGTGSQSHRVRLGDAPPA